MKEIEMSVWVLQKEIRKEKYRKYKREKEKKERKTIKE